MVQFIKELFESLRNNPANHLGLGDIRLTIAQQEEIVDACCKESLDFMALAEYVNALAEDCNKQSTYLHIHGITDPWAESREVFMQLPENIREYLEILRIRNE